MIHHYLSENEIKCINELHVIRKCGTCTELKKPFSDSKNHCNYPGAQADNLQCDRSEWRKLNEERK